MSNFISLRKLRGFASDVGFRLSHRGRDEWKVRADGSRIIVQKNGRDKDSIAWSEIVSISAYRADKLTYAPIRLVFTGNDHHSVMVEELMEGFEELVTMVTSRLPEPKRHWRSEIEHGEAFDGNPSVLWRRSESD